MNSIQSASRFHSSFVLNRRAIQLSLLSWVAFCMSPDIFHRGNTPLEHICYNLLLSWKPFALDKLILLPALILLFCWCAGKFPSAEWKRASIRFPAVLFSLFMVLGKSYDALNSWWLALEWRNGQILKSAIFFFGYYAFSSRLFALIYLLMNKISACTPPSHPRTGWYGRKVLSHPFVTIFLTLFICYIPHLIISAPAMLMGDTWGQVTQGYAALRHTGTFYILPEQMLDPDVFLNQSHPVVHTILLHAFLAVGNRIHSLNLGLLLYSIFQLACICGAIALVASDLLKHKLISVRYSFVFPLYGILHPMIYDYSTLVTKDVFYAAFLIVFLAELLILLSGRSDKAVWARVLMAGFGALLFRNEARIPILLGCLTGICVCKKNRKLFMKAGGVLLAFSVLIFNVSDKRLVPWQVRPRLVE